MNRLANELAFRNVSLSISLTLLGGGLLVFDYGNIVGVGFSIGLIISSLMISIFTAESITNKLKK